MKILISTGIYPPDIGGPAQYAKNLYNTWKEQGHEVEVATFGWEKVFPILFRHLLFLTKIIRKGWNADLIIVLDTWSAAVPTMFACMFMKKKYIIRTGGDFLWEQYVERTGKLILLRDFYDLCINTFSRKEKIIYKVSGFVLRNANLIIFSTEWQKKIFESVYRLDPVKTKIVENYCGPRMIQINPQNRTFIASTRELKWKNIDILRRAFKSAQSKVKDMGFENIELDTTKVIYDSFQDRINQSYAVILTSLGDISPNMIFDAIRAGVPFILTQENGISDRIKDCAIFVNPKDENDIIDKIVWISDPLNRAIQAEKIRKFDWVHTWENIANEIILLYGQI